MSVVVGFVIYYPQSPLFERLDLLQELGVRTYIFDNSPSDDACKKWCEGKNNVEYITGGRNLGLGPAMAVLCATAYARGAEGFLFFDQDTVFTRDTYNYVLNFFEGSIAVIHQNYLQIAFDSKQTSDSNIESVNMAINSGSLFILKNLNEVGWHNHTYYVDGVDYELCMRSRNFGMRVGRVHNTPGFDHESEQPDKFCNVFGRRLALRRYPWWRVLDSFKAYFRMMGACCWRLDFVAVLLVFRSFAIFLIGFFLALIFVRK